MSCCWYADRLRVEDPHAVADAAMHAEVQHAETETAAVVLSSVPTLLVFTQGAWPYAASVAMQLHRAGHPVWFAPQRQTMFGKEYVDLSDSGAGVRIWRAAPREEAARLEIEPPAAAAPATLDTEGSNKDQRLSGIAGR